MIKRKGAPRYFGYWCLVIEIYLGFEFCYLLLGGIPLDHWCLTKLS